MWTLLLIDYYLAGMQIMVYVWNKCKSCLATNFFRMASD